jgi:membrane protease YdiL (CAAX protease family)
MTLECILFAIPLIVLSLFLHSSGATKNAVTNQIMAAAQYSSNHSAIPQSAYALLADIVTGVGAGIYEELLFRLVLILSLLVLFQDVLGWGKSNSIVLAVLVSAALFGAHHHIDFLTGRPNQGDLFDWTKFVFRTMAGIYFAILFAIRGFGITAGTHAFYDIIATLINAVMFTR